MDKKMVFEKTISTPYFQFKLSANTLNYNRFGIIISNTVVKKSTRRHFWKRKFTHEVRAWPSLKKDILVIVSRNIENLPATDLKKEVNKILQRIRE